MGEPTTADPIAAAEAKAATVANASRGEVTFEVCGQIYHVLATPDLVVRCESVMGSLLAFSSRLSGGQATLTEIATLLHMLVADEKTREPAIRAVVDDVFHRGVLAFTPALNRFLYGCFGGDAARQAMGKKMEEKKTPGEAPAVR